MRRQVALPKDLADRAEAEAARHGLSLPGYVALAVQSALNAPPPAVDSPPLPEQLPELTVLVRLPVSDGDDHDEDWWWQRACGDWRLSATTRAFSRWLGAAGTDGVVRYLWKIEGWEEQEGKARATRRLPASPRGLAVAGLAQVVGCRLPPSRNPVHVRGPVERR